MGKRHSLFDHAPFLSGKGWIADRESMAQNKGALTHFKANKSPPRIRNEMS